MKHGSTILCALALVATATSSVDAAPKEDAYTLQSNRAVGTVDRVEVVLEVGGSLKVVEAATPDGKQPTSVKMSAQAALAYAEKTLSAAASGGPSARAIRHYDKAEASIRVGEEAFQPALRDQRRLIGVEVRSPRIILYCPQGLLAREELDLVDLLGNSLLLDRLLPPRAVAVGGSWKHSDDLLAALCGLDSVSSSDAQSVLQSVNDGSAQMEMAGHVSGSVNGRSTRLQVKAKYRFELKAERITWFALLVKENREHGPVGPGLDVVARLQMKIAPAVPSEQLAEDALKDLPLEPTAELEQLSYVSPEGGWRATLDRRWVLISERKELTVLRMVDEGKYLAQCSVSALSAGKDKPLPLSDFQDEVRQALGKNFRQFVRAGQSMNEAEYQVYRVEAQGDVLGVPMQWTYYRLADKLGRAMVVLFTVESNLEESFQENDRDLVRAIRFVDPKVAAK